MKWQDYPHWSYSGFNRFRERLGRVIGIDLYTMIGFGDNAVTPWSTVKDDIKYLLNHSDCEGTIGPNRCAKIIPRLQDIIKDPNFANGSYDPIAEYDYDQCKKLIAVMEECVHLNQKLQFC